MNYRYFTRLQLHFRCSTRRAIRLCLTVFMVLAPMQAAQSDLVSYWAMDDAAGSTVRDLIGGNHGTIVVNPEEPNLEWDTAGSGRTGSLDDYSLQWSRRDPVGYVNVPNSDATNISGDGASITISAWLEPIAVSGANIAVLSKGNAWNYGYMLGLNSDDNPNSHSLSSNAGTFPLSNPTVTDISTLDPADRVGTNSHPVPFDQWTHVAYTFDGSDGTASLYAGGNLVAQKNSGHTGIYNSDEHPLNFGREQLHGGRWGYLGGMDDVSLWNESLDLASIGRLANGESPLDLFDVSTIQWNVDALGDWNHGSNWTPRAVPNFAHSTVVLGGVNSSARSVITDEAVTVRAIQFDSSQSYAVIGQGSVTLAAQEANPGLSVSGDIAAGAHQFQVQVNLSGDTIATVGSGASLAFNKPLNLNGHTLTANGDGTVQINNQLITGGGSVVGVAGFISGSGLIEGDLVNAGATLSPGNSPGTMQITGSYHQAAEGSLLIEIANDVHDRLQVDGAVNLAGTLEVELLNGFEPSAGSSFNILQLGALETTFDQIDLPSLGTGLAWDASALYSEGVLSVLTTTVPEPATIQLFGLGMLLLASQVRRKNTNSHPSQVVNRKEREMSHQFGLRVSRWVLILTLSGFSFVVTSSGRADLVGYWPMNDDTSGVWPGTTTMVMDVSGNENHGTLQGTYIGNFGFDGAGSGRSGEATDNSLQWLRSDDVQYVDIPNSNSLNISGTGASVTLSAWLEPIQVGGRNIGVISKGAWDQAYYLGVNSDHGPSHSLSSNTGTLPSAGVTDISTLENTSPDPTHPVPFDTWSHVAYTFDGGTGDASLYVNGTLVRTENNGRNGIDNSGTVNLRFGVEQLGEGTRWAYVGGMDDVAIWNEPLSESLVQALAAGTSPMELEVSSIEWKANGLGDWDEFSNWSPSIVPDSPGTTVVLGNAITSPGTIGLDTDRTVNGLTFSNSNGYAIGGHGSVNLDAESGNATLLVAGSSDAGDHEFQATVNLLDDTDAVIGPDASLSFNGALNLGDRTLTVDGGGVLNVNNNQLSGTGGSIVATNGTIGGSGTISGNVVLDGGILAPGQANGAQAITANGSGKAVPEPSGMLLLALVTLHAFSIWCGRRRAH